MELCKEFWQIIEKIRKERNLSISLVCEDIISERTYYRYMRSGCEMRFDILSKLSHRLGLDSVEIVKFAFYFNKKDPGITKFLFRLQTKQFSDIEPIYQSILEHKEENLSLQKLLNACIAKYEWIVGKIAKEDYISVLEKSLEYSSAEENNNIFILLTRVLYYEALPNNTRYSAECLAQAILKADFRMGFIFYVIALDCLMYSVLGSEKISIETFRLLTARFEEILELVDIKPFHMQKSLYKAYLHFLDGQIEEMKHPLFLYAMNLSVLFGGESYCQAKKKVEKLFKINLTDFLKEQSETVAIPKHFVFE